MIVNAEVKLDGKKALNKEYFDKKLNQFTREVRRSFVLEELKLKRKYYKPSAYRKIKKEIRHLKWKFY